MVYTLPFLFLLVFSTSLSLFNQSTASTVEQGKFFILWPWTMTNEYLTWTTLPNILATSCLIQQFFSRHTPTHQTDCSTWTTKVISKMIKRWGWHQRETIITTMWHIVQSNKVSIPKFTWILASDRVAIATFRATGGKLFSSMRISRTLRRWKFAVSSLLILEASWQKTQISPV